MWRLKRLHGRLNGGCLRGMLLLDLAHSNAVIAHVFYKKLQAKGWKVPTTRFHPVGRLTSNAIEFMNSTLDIMAMYYPFFRRRSHACKGDESKYPKQIPKAA